MLFSAHVADTSALAALRRKTPQSADVPGLRSARTATCAPFTRGVLPRPQLGREALLACWTDEDALDNFLADHPTGQEFSAGWHVRMKLIRAAGVWPGLTHDMVGAAGAKATTASGPSLAITIGTAYLRTVVPFMRVNSGLEDQFLDTPSGIWGTAMTNLPQRLVATLTIWESADAALEAAAAALGAGESCALLLGGSALRSAGLRSAARIARAVERGGHPEALRRAGTAGTQGGT